jgi:hypothetical protein
MPTRKTTNEPHDEEPEQPDSLEFSDQTGGKPGVQPQDEKQAEEKGYIGTAAEDRDDKS